MRRIPILAVLAAALPFAAVAATEPVPGMPQIAFGHAEQSRLLTAQVIWLLLIFGLLYHLLKTYALPLVAEVLEARQARIAGDLDAARGAKAAADAALAAHHAATSKARAEAQGAIAAATQQAQTEAAAKAEVVNRRLAKQITAAEASIAAARDAAMAALPQVATETAEALVAKLAGVSDAAAVQTAVARQLAARGG